MSGIIKVLFLAANPSDTSRLMVDEEIRTIEQSLRSAEFRDRFDIEQHLAVRVTDLQEYLLRHKPDIVHFSGHGSESSEIILKDNTGKKRPVPVNALEQLFSVLKDNIRCVVLNTCFSEAQALAITEHIDCVIGMSKEIGDSTAIAFAAAFYQALGYGRNVKTAFDLGCLQIDFESLDDQDVPRLLVRTGVDPTNVFLLESSGVGRPYRLVSELLRDRAGCLAKLGKAKIGIIFFLVILALGIALGTTGVIRIPLVTPARSPTAIAHVPSHTPISTPSVISTPTCLYQRTTDAATIIHLIQLEAEVVVIGGKEGIAIIQGIFEKNAYILDAASGEEWHDSTARYEALFANADYLEAKNIEIQPAGAGVTQDVAWFTSESQGRLIASDGTEVSYARTPHECHWTLRKNSAGCWVITKFVFNASDVPFPP